MTTDVPAISGDTAWLDRLALTYRDGLTPRTVFQFPTTTQFCPQCHGFQGLDAAGTFCGACGGFGRIIRKLTR